MCSELHIPRQATTSLGFNLGKVLSRACYNSYPITTYDYSALIAPEDSRRIYQAHSICTSTSDFLHRLINTPSFAYRRGCLFCSFQSDRECWPSVRCRWNHKTVFIASRRSNCDSFPWNDVPDSNRFANGPVCIRQKDANTTARPTNPRRVVDKSSP